MKRRSRVFCTRLMAATAMFGLLLMVVTGCGGGSAASTGILPANTGITGTAQFYQSGGDPSPTPQANVTMTLLTPDGGAEIARQQTDAHGKFKFNLFPGKYLIVPLPDVPNHLTPTGSITNVTVISGLYTSVTVGYVRNNP